MSRRTIRRRARRQVPRVVPGAGQAHEAAVRLYRLTAAFPPSLASYARDLDQIVAESEDGAEGPRAFREKRKPVWKMR